MASKKIKLTMGEAGVILDYHDALHKESALVLNGLMKLIEIFGLQDNDDVGIFYDKNLYEFCRISKINSCKDIFDSLLDIFLAEKNKLPKNELLRLKGFYKDYLKTFESNTSNYFNKIKLIKKDEAEVVNTEIEVLDSIENLRFLVNRVINLIDSKI